MDCVTFFNKKEVSPLTSGRLSHSSGPLNGGSLTDSPPVSPSEIDDLKVIFSLSFHFSPFYIVSFTFLSLFCLLSLLPMRQPSDKLRSFFPLTHLNPFPIFCNSFLEFVEFYD